MYVCVENRTPLKTYYIQGCFEKLRVGSQKIGGLGPKNVIVFALFYSFIYVFLRLCLDKIFFYPTEFIYPVMISPLIIFLTLQSFKLESCSKSSFLSHLCSKTFYVQHFLIFFCTIRRQNQKFTGMSRGMGQGRFLLVNAILKNSFV